MSLRTVRHVVLAACGAVALAACGGGSSSPTVTPTPVPTPTPAPTPTPLACNPSPPPLHSIKVKVHDDSGWRKILDSRPRVVNAGESPGSYCELAGFGFWPFCFNRDENDPQAAACDSMSVGQALDTGRWGPTWYYNGEPCTAVGETTPGCRNHPDNQFLVIAKGPGEYAACANPAVPLAGDRCGVLVIN